jgi:hypothetical protein
MITKKVLVVLTYSNWETGCICFCESFESLSQGLQNALSTQRRYSLFVSITDPLNNLKFYSKSLRLPKCSRYDDFGNGSHGVDKLF